MKKRIIPLLLCLVMVAAFLALLPTETNAATAQETGNSILENVLKQDGTFPETLPEGETTHTAFCYACNAEKEWKPLTKAMSTNFSSGDHYYVPKNVSLTGQVFQMSGQTVCVHTNGKTLTDTTYRFAIVKGTMNIMGAGTISAKPGSGVRGAIFLNNGTLNVYGTKIISASTVNLPVLSLYNSSAVVNAWNATLDAGTQPTITTNGKVNLYNCTAIGAAVEQDDPKGGNGSTAKINLVDSTLPGIKSEIGTVTVSGAAKITGTGLELTEGKTIDPTKLTEGASIAIASKGTFTASGMSDYAKYFQSADKELSVTVKTDGALANLDKQAYGEEIIKKAAALEGKFPSSGTYDAICPVCNVSVTWKPMLTTITSSTNANGHYYLTADSTGPSCYQIFAGGYDICFHTNGKTFSDPKHRFAIVSSGKTMNVMGSGAITGTATSTGGGMFFINNGTVNVYGTTVGSTGNNGIPVFSLYNAGASVNLWNAKMESGTSPLIKGAGVVTMYNSTASGAAALFQDVEYVSSGVTKYNDCADVPLKLIDSTITGVNLTESTVSVSGATKITGTGLSLPAGKTIDPSKLTEGASIAIASEGAFTGAGMADYAKYFSAANADHEITVSSTGILRCWEPGALLVTADGKEDAVDDVLTAWATGNYAYIKLYGNDSLAMNGEDIVVDLAGFDLTVTGTGNVRAFDSANDTYDKSACGTIINGGTVTFAETVTAPNGNTYVTVTESNRATAHRLEIKLASVSLRTTAAGLYYKAKYTCDSTLAEKVKTYGVIVSVDNMPGADYANDGEDINKYTVAQAPFQSGVTATSGSIFGIMKDSREPVDNDAYAKVPIYANAYIDLGNGPIVADITNPGKKVGEDGFTGIALSLFDVMAKLDDAYNNYNTTTRLQLDNFYFQWKDKGMDWDFDYIGQTAGTTDGIDNSDIELKFDEGTTDAECPVCKKKVTWTAFQPSTVTQSLQGHYYLTDDVTFTGTDASGIVYNGTKNTELCFHLNGHIMTAPKTRAFFGSYGVLNVMGNGNVTGYNNVASGAAVQTNNSVATNGVHLYGGTYKRASGTSAKAAAIATHGCGYICVYEGATIDAPGAMAILQSVPLNSRNSYVGLFGCTVNGDVVTLGSDLEKGFTSTTELVDCTINGEVEASQSTVYLSGAPKITAVNLLNESVLNTKILTEGANIGIVNTGIFTMQSESVQRYTGYFHGINAADVITVRDNALHCGPDYTGDLEFEAGTTNAMCPVCAKVVTWTPVDGSAVLDNSTAKATMHYYLTKDITFTATNGELSFLSPGHGSHTVCVHLNGHDFTGTNTRFVYGGTSVTNVMGSGTVSCARGDTYKYGSTIQTNTSNVNGTINLYGGIWTQLESGTYTADDYVISMSDNGGGINVYEDATVVANSNGKAIYLGTCNLRDTIAGICGTVKGDIYAAGANQSKDFVSYITVDGGTVEGTLDINGVNAVTVGHAAKIQLLDMEETSLVTMDKLTDGANITVQNEGVFTEPHESAEDWVEYFHAANKNDLIVVQENALRYKVDYTSKLYPDAEGKAYCPVCKETVQWTAVSSGETALTAEAGAHYYLTADILYEAEYDSKGNVSFLYGGTNKNAASCFHLNGHNLTATKAHAIFGGYGNLNIMGDGVVTGRTASKAYGGAVQVNNSVIGNTVNLYSGTYKNASNSVAGSGVLATYSVGGRICVYEDASVLNSDDVAIYLGSAKLCDTRLEIYGATIQGGITTASPSTETYTSSIYMDDATITGELSVASGVSATFDGRTKIGKLTVAEGVAVEFTNMLEGSAINVSANGIFSTAMPLADEWLKYITCADEGDWIIVRDKQFYQETKQDIPTASENDKTALLDAYVNKVIRYGEMHNHTNSGPYSDDGTGTKYSTGADGKNSLTEWIAEMDRLEMDFAFIVDHGMSIHMYNENFRPDYFIGGTEPGTTITDSKANPKSPHYNMLFADPAKLESIFFKWESKYKPVKWNLTNYPNALTPSEDGYRIKYPPFTTAEFGQLAKDVYAAGGLLVQVHPKYDSYIYSNDPMDYFFADYSGFEITTGSGGNMMYKDNDEAYETWVDLLEMGKKIWATAGSDRHRLPDISGMTVMYTETDNSADYMETVRAGNMAPGWIGIRMNVNGTEMGGETDFTGNRLQFSVGDIYNTGKKDYVETPNPYVAGHTYRVELYDDGGLLMTTTIDPTQMNYFAIDCDETAKFYRVVVWDETENERIGVSNPIWNTAPVEE